MTRLWFTSLSLLFIAYCAQGKSEHPLLADYATRAPLAHATVFDQRGTAIAMTSAKGRLPRISDSSFPVTIRYLGYEEKTLDSISADTIFMHELPMHLSEVTIETRDQKALHMLGYVREYSTLTSYTDTVFLFREKMVDFMIPPDGRSKFKGWRTPRILKSKSYYHFTDAYGLDSVSNTNNHHFSWSDWLAIAPAAQIPDGLTIDKSGTDTIRGKYSPTEIWARNADKVTVSVDVLADTSSRKWVPNIKGFFSDGIDFERFKMRLNCSNVVGQCISPSELTSYTYTIESRGRGREMFKFHRYDQPFFTTTYAEVYITDKEYITIKEAKKWEQIDFNNYAIDICEPREAPELQASILDIIDRVENVDHDRVRLSLEYDFRITKERRANRNYRIGNRLLLMLKQLTGLDVKSARKNINKNYNSLKSSKH